MIFGGEIKTVAAYLHDLRDEYKRYFESTLALKLQTDMNLLKSVKQVSKNILSLFSMNKTDVLMRLKAEPKIRYELFSHNYYGHLEMNNAETMSVDEIYNAIIDELANVESDLSTCMLIHAIFIQRIFDHLTIKSVSGESSATIDKEKQFLCAKLFANELFADRARKELNREVMPATQAGINRNRVFQTRLQSTVKKHSPGMLKFAPDFSSLFFKNSYAANIPFVCGPSGHIGSLLLGASLYGNLNPEELTEYTLAGTIFLINGGNHCFHECMIVAKQIGILYENGNYIDSIPDSVKQTEVFTDLVKQFPEFLESSCVISAKY